MVFRCIVLAMALALAAPSAAGEVNFDQGVFQNDMVLQREKRAPIWGRSKPNEKVAVSFGDVSVETEAGADGRWRVVLPAMKAHEGQTLKAQSGSEEAKLTNVAVGEVWLCSGQSNMTLDVGASMNGKEEGAADQPRIRFLDHLGWRPCSPKTTLHCSAVGYYFAREIQRELDVPIGLIIRAQSMSAIQPWTPIETLHLTPPLQEEYTRNARRYLDHAQQWLSRSEKAFARGEPIERLGDSDITQAGSLYRSHIAGFRGFAIRGFLWYQGESNTRDGTFYATRMCGLIKGWRQMWGDETLPFYFVQIAPFDADGDLPALWEGQLDAVRVLPHTELSHSNDLGYSVHPTNKHAIGGRLAKIALSKTYGKQGVAFAGPRYKSHAIETGQVRITFDFTDSGLISRDGKPLTHFEIAGSDGRFMPAEASIEGSNVVLRSSAIKEPEQARFAWSRDAVHNLSNRAGLPAYPFRTAAPPRDAR